VRKQNANGSGGIFQVSYSGLVRRALKKLFKRAKQLGIYSEAVAAAKGIDSRLHTDPGVFGEAFQNLTHTKGQMRIGFVRPLGVEYAFHESERKVFVVKPLFFLTEPGPNPP
jgi:hypothetical protein